MNISTMATREGNWQIERIVDATARLQVIDCATKYEAQEFMELRLYALSCTDNFPEADSAVVRNDAAQRLVELVEQFQTAMAHS